MLDSGFQSAQAASPTGLPCCPKCDAELAVLSVIAGRAKTEYWVMQCTERGGIHLDIVKPAPLPHTA
jgi:hypothetical protein